MTPRAPATALVVSFLWACSDTPASRFYELPDTEAEIAFIVVLNEAGGIARIVGPYGTSAEGTDFGSPKFVVEERESSALTVALDRQELQEITPLLAWNRIEQTQVTDRAIPTECTHGEISEDMSFVTVHLPQTAKVFRVDFSEGAAGLVETSLAEQPVLESINLALPIDFAGCGTTPSAELTPFGAVPFLLSPELVDTWNTRTFFDLVRVDRQRVVAVTSDSILLIERGGEVRTDAGFSVPLAPYVQVHSIARTTPPYEEPAGLLVAAAACAKESTVPCAGVTGLLMELEVDASGLRLVRTTSVSELPEPKDANTDSEGRALAIGVPGFFSQQMGGGALEQDPPLDAFELERLYVDPRRRETVLASGRESQLYVRRAGRWSEANRPTQALGFTFWGLTSLPTSEGEELWVTGTDSHVSWLPPGQTEWNRLEPVLGPEYAECTKERAPCGGIRSRNTFRRAEGVIGDGPASDRVIAITSGCTGVFELRRDDSCAAVIRYPEIALDGAGVDALDVFERIVTVGMSYGGLFEYELAP